MSSDFLTKKQKGQRALVNLKISAMPIVNLYIEKMNLAKIIDRFISKSANEKLSPGFVLMLLLRNILSSSFPLYKIPKWSNEFDPKQLDCHEQLINYINDDRIGRCLDKLFLADRATLLTVIVLKTMDAFDIRMSEFHQDSTTVSFYGKYKKKAKFDKKPVFLIQGFNKDHRPDLKQLVFNLVVSSDASVPIHFNIHDGNVTDDTIQIETWERLRKLVGYPNFIYVADCKLCTTRNMNHIDSRGGKFITVMPQTRKECTDFNKWIKEHDAQWEYLYKTKVRGDSGEKTNKFRGLLWGNRSKEGYRIIWIHSSEKQKMDAQRRENRLCKAEDQLFTISNSLNRYYLKTKAQISNKVKSIFKKNNVNGLIDFRIESEVIEVRKQKRRGRPSKNISYRIKRKTVYLLWFERNKKVIKKEEWADGIFPLITNIEDLSIKQIFKHYKYQPNIEKRHSYFKSVLEVAPMFLKTPERIEAILFLYFLCLLIYALVERDLAKEMKIRGIKSIPIYPERRECRKPTTERIFELFDNFYHHLLYEKDVEVDDFYDQIDEVQNLVIDLIGVDKKNYGLF